MIVTKDNTRLYLSNWDYNRCRITDALAVIVENNGGKVKPQNTAIISNRTLEHGKREIEERISTLEEIQKENYTEKRAEYIKTKRADLEKMETINNDPITVKQHGYITFVLDGTYYYYQTSDNPFFEFYYQKTPTNRGIYSQDAVLEQDPKEWLFDCFFSFSACDADIKEAANLIFNMLVNAKHCTISRDTKRVRVPNTYDGGYHYETKTAPGRYEKLGEWAL